jgi:NADH-quinone oxidoreductase subunit M
MAAFSWVLLPCSSWRRRVWIERFNINYHLGVDGISFWFVPLTAFITVIVVLAGWESITERVNQYMGAFLILSGLMIGVFCALGRHVVLRVL